MMRWASRFSILNIAVSLAITTTPTLVQDLDLNHLPPSVARRCLSAIVALLLACGILALPAGATPVSSEVRTRTNIDRGWSFALGDAQNPARDFGYGTAAFFFAKAGYGDGPASPKFDDRAWRKVDLPHDWAVEMAFDPNGSGNHGSKAVGPGFPSHDIGWYRKTIAIPASDEGRRIAVEFDGAYRDAVVWFNGHYIGEEHSGYSSFRYDLTDYVNYGGPNVLVVRVNASVEEGWFYEGAGIYRHVWLTKTDPLHLAQWGTFVTSLLSGPDATVTARAKIQNDDDHERKFTVDEEIFDADGHSLAARHGDPVTLAAGTTGEYTAELPLRHPALWSIETPVLHRLVTTIREGNSVRDRFETNFGVRAIRWDPNTGFWLNGRNIKLKGTANHQDFAGVGIAMPDALQAYRLERLKAMGVNAYRTAHNPPTPEMLDAADRLGMLVIDEHRMMGTTPEIADQLRRLVVRDRNHPSVILWSVGNEEWALEGNELGARLTKLMQAQVRALDPTRPSTVATSSGDKRGSSTTTEVAGFNYRTQHDADDYHKAFPNTPIVMTEEGSTFATRGIYFDDRAGAHLAAYDKPQRPTGSSSIEQGWRAVVERPWMSGMFVWTGFDYRGETTPFGWPAISSQFGMLDTTGQLKDSAYYLKSWWVDAPMVHIVGHWTWPDRLGQQIPIWVYSNAESVELTLDGRSLGRRDMPRNGHLEWAVAYQPGVLVANGFRGQKLIASEQVVTAGAARLVKLRAEGLPVGADGRRIVVVTVSASDAKGAFAPTAGNLISFATSPGAHIIGVGNGDPSSHEADQFVDKYSVERITGWEIADLPANDGKGPFPSPAGLAWRDPFQWYPPGSGPRTPGAFLLRATWQSGSQGGGQRTLFLPLLSPTQRVFVGGEDLTAKLKTDDGGQSLQVSAAAGPREITVLVPDHGEEALRKLKENGIGGSNVAYVQSVEKAPAWQRSLFSGYAQVLVEIDAAAGGTLTATAPGLRPSSIALKSVESR